MIEYNNLQPSFGVIVPFSAGKLISTQDSPELLIIQVVMLILSTWKWHYFLFDVPVLFPFGSKYLCCIKLDPKMKMGINFLLPHQSCCKCCKLFQFFLLSSTSGVCSVFTLRTACTSPLFWAYRTMVSSCKLILSAFHLSVIFHSLSPLRQYFVFWLWI